VGVCKMRQPAAGQLAYPVDLRRWVYCRMTPPPGGRPSIVRFVDDRCDGRPTTGSPRSNATSAANSRISLAYRCAREAASSVSRVLPNPCRRRLRPLQAFANDVPPSRPVFITLQLT
jgi:hypothetical protein